MVGLPNDLEVDISRAMTFHHQKMLKEEIKKLRRKNLWRTVALEFLWRTNMIETRTTIKA